MEHCDAEWKDGVHDPEFGAAKEVPIQRVDNEQGDDVDVDSKDGKEGDPEASDADAIGDASSTPYLPGGPEQQGGVEDDEADQTNTESVEVGSGREVMTSLSVSELLDGKIHVWEWCRWDRRRGQASGLKRVTNTCTVTNLSLC